MNKKELAEQIAGILYKNKTDEADEGCWIEGKDFYKVADLIVEAMGVQPGMRWVKASERLPENTLPFYHIKIEGTKQIGRYRSLSEGWLNYEGDFFPNDQIEWLEEAIEPKIEAMGVQPGETKKENWRPVSQASEYDGTYLGYIEKLEVCGAINHYQRTVYNHMNKWVLTEGETLLFYMELPPSPNQHTNQLKADL